MRLAQQGGYLAVEEGHPRSAGAERVGSQVQPAFGQPGGQVRRPVFRVAELGQATRGDGDEGGVAGQGLVQAHPVQLVAQHARAYRGVQGRPAVYPGRHARHVVHHDPVGQAQAAHGHAHGGAQQVPGQAAAGVHPPLRSARGDDVLDRLRGQGRHRNRAAPFPRPAELVAFPGPLSRGHQRELDRRGVHRAGHGRAAGLDGGIGLGPG